MTEDFSQPEFFPGKLRLLDNPTFMKEDLVPIMGEDRMIQQMPPAFLL